MNELKERLRADMTDALRSRDQVRLRTLRMALASITNEEVSGAAHELSDEDIVKVLTREAKKRREAAEAFEAAGRADQAEAERAEGDVLATYLPAQVSDDELAGLVSAAIAETGAAGMPAMGKVMKAVTPQVAGRADGARVAAEVRRQLSQGLRASPSGRYLSWLTRYKTAVLPSHASRFLTLVAKPFGAAWRSGDCS